MRSGLASLLAPVLPPAARAASSPPTADPDPWYIRLGGAFAEIDPVARTFRYVSRLLFLADPPIEPVEVVERYQYVLRIFNEDPTDRCRVCPMRCNAARSQWGDWRCIVPAPGTEGQPDADA